MSVYAEAIIELNDDLIAIESKAAALRAKYDGAEKRDAEFIGVLDEITASFQALRSSIGRVDVAATKAREKVKEEKLQ